MKKFALIGYPIAHSQSPMLFNEAYSGKYPYSLIEEEDFEKAWQRFLDEGFSAINVTAPFKEKAFLKADIVDESARKCRAANIIVRREGLLHAFNSDYLAVRSILASLEGSSVAVIGGGGAGRSAFLAAEDLGKEVRLFRHNQLLEQEVCADIVVFTLPQSAPGYESIRCRHLLEANYKNPCCQGLCGISNYIGGEVWLREQARLGYELMTGEAPALNSPLFVACF